MKKHKYQTISTNAIDPASNASVFGKGVPGKGGATNNFDATKDDSEIRRIINRKEV